MLQRREFSLWLDLILPARAFGNRTPGETAMTVTMTRTALALSALMFSAAGAQAEMLAAQNGMTLYTFDKDKGDQSVCYDDCAVNWPPYVGTAADKMTDDWKLVQRKDGTMQRTYDGKP